MIHHKINSFFLAFITVKIIPLLYQRGEFSEGLGQEEFIIWFFLPGYALMFFVYWLLLQLSLLNIKDIAVQYLSSLLLALAFSFFVVPYRIFYEVVGDYRFLIPLAVSVLFGRFVKKLAFKKGGIY